MNNLNEQVNRIKKLMGLGIRLNNEGASDDWAGFSPPSGYVGDAEPVEPTIVQILNNHEAFGNQFNVMEKPGIGSKSDDTIVLETDMPSEYLNNILGDPNFEAMGVSWRDYYEDYRVIDGGSAGTIIIFSGKHYDDN